MSWLVFLSPDRPGRSARGACAGWWRGPALVAAVLRFCLALGAAALTVVATGLHTV